MCILQAVIRHCAPKYDLLGLAQGELRSLDPVREVGLEERQGGKRVRLLVSRLERGAQQFRVERLEERDPAWVEAEAGVRRARCGGGELDVSRSENRPDQVVEGRHLAPCVERLRDLVRLVAQLTERLAPADRRDPRQLFLDLGGGESTRDAVPCARLAHVVEERSRAAGEVKAVHVRHVARHRTRSAPRQKGEARQADGPSPLVVGPSVEEERAVGRRLRLDATAVDDDGSREVMGGGSGPIAPHHLLERLVEVAGVEAARHLSGAPVGNCASHDRGARRRRGEDLGLVPEQKSALNPSVFRRKGEKVR